MSDVTLSILSLVLIPGLQIIVYVIFLRPRILRWGASRDEVKMPLVGDDLAYRISATRAITIHAAIAKVWQWVIQLGADRGGFFSYAFIERAMGYKMREPDPKPEFQDMEVGRMIPASLDESKSIIKYNFPVIAVETEKSFVLEKWGAFVLKEIGPDQTRLIVRTHGQETPGLLKKVEDFIGEAAHYIMERRMLMGLKFQIETGRQISSIVDNLWLLGLFLSAVGIASMVIVGEGVLGGLLASVFGIVWIWVLLIWKPRPVFSLGLLPVIAMAIVWLH